MPLFSLRDKLAQSLMPRIASDAYYADSNIRSHIQTLVGEVGIGGICVFAGDALQTAQMIQELQNIALQNSRLPLLVSADFEHGVAMRLRGGTAFPHAMTLGMSNDTGITERVARTIALESKALGIHWNFAPVADIHSNPINPVIGIRSFGEWHGTVSEHVEAYIRGTQGSGIMATAKHFPGHGDTAVDSHVGLPKISYDGLTPLFFSLYLRELLPFKAAIDAGVRSIMVGHIVADELDDSNIPASLSHKMMTGILREEWDFRGVIVTDALDMKAITDRWSADEASLRAFHAGADILLLPPDPLQTLYALEEAVQRDSISMKRVHDAFQTILEAKEWCGIVRYVSSSRDMAAIETHDIRPIPRKAQDIPDIDRQENALLALEAAKGGLRWFGSRHIVQPLTQFRHIAAFALVTENVAPAATDFFKYLGQNYPHDCDFAFIDADISDEEMERLYKATQEADIVLFAVFVPALACGKDVDINERLRLAAEKIGHGRNKIAVLFGNPDIRMKFPADAFLCTFSPSEPALAAAAFELVQSQLPEDLFPKDVIPSL